MPMYIENIVEEVIEYIRSPDVYISIHEWSNIVVIDAFYTHNFHIYVTNVYICSRWYNTDYTHDFFQ